MQNQELQDRGLYLSRLWILLVGMLATGLFFRFINLDKKVYWNDEVWVSIRLSGHTGAQMIEQIFDGREIGVDDLQKYQRVGPENRVADTMEFNIS